MILLISHILADFYFQTNQIVKGKYKGVRWIFIHCMIHFGVMLIVTGSVIDSGEYRRLLFACVSICVVHGVIDSIKCKILKRDQNSKYRPMLFLLDQALHVITILIGSTVFDLKLDENNGILQSVFSFALTQEVLVILLAVLICWRPASYFVAEVFSVVSRKSQNGDSTEDNEIRIGSWIGILEREIILLLGLMHQFGAIGLVLAAKSLARYKQLEDKEFAERYLVGTLISTLVAILAVVMCQYFKVAN